jgi:hypothetical protein
MVAERLHVGREPPADHDEAAGGREDLGRRELERAHGRPLARIRGQKRGRRPLLLGPVDGGVGVADDLAVREQHGRGRDPRRPPELLLVGERLIRVTRVGKALQLEHPADALGPRREVELPKREARHRQLARRRAAVVSESCMAPA